MKTFYFILPALVFIACSSAPEAPVNEVTESGVFEMLALHVQSRMKLSFDCSAGGALVMRNGKILYEEYFGKTHPGPGADPVTARSRFPFFSVTKGFASAVLLSLVSDGTIGLDDPVCKYLDYFTGPGPGGKFPRQKVTIRHLASHSSGIPVDSFPPRIYRNEPPFHDVTLVYEPGKGFTYTELGMRVLGQVMEEATGKTYEELLKERITGPLGLESVGYLHKGQNTRNIVHTCVGPDSSYIAFCDEFSQKPYPGSGLYGNLRDIARYAQLWLDGGKVGDRVIFHEDLLRQAWEPQPATDTPNPEYGLLFWLFPQVNAVVFSGMAHTICAILPEEKLVVVMGLNQRRHGRGWDFQTEKLNLARIGAAICERLEL